MTKSVYAILIAVAAALFIGPGTAYAEKIYVEGPSARFRAGPGTNYPILWEAPRYTPLEYLAKYQTWYAVRDREGDVAWVHEQVIGKGSAAIVIKKKANIRKGPGTSNPIAYSVEQGYLFLVIGGKGSWLNVKDSDGDKGWVLDKLVWTSK